MSLLEIGLIMLFGFIMVYALVDRVCKCLENRAMAKAFFASVGKNGTVFNNDITKFAEAMKNIGNVKKEVK